MNGKQLFCLSLIILSVVMGLHWFKNKPKTRKKSNDRPKVALNLEDLQIQDGNEENPDDGGKEGDEPGTDQGDEGNDQQSPDDQPGDEGDSPDDKPPEDATATGTTELVDNASGPADLPPELNDPIIVALRTMQRNPFESSPYAALVEKLREEEEKPEEEEIEKQTRLLSAEFTATIKTRKELVAVIDSRLYRKGDRFQDKIITEIAPELVSLDTKTDLFLIPKVGVAVNIASDGTYTFEDSFRKN